MRIATSFLVIITPRETLATRAYMRIATIDYDDGEVVSMLATRTHMRIATPRWLLILYTTCWQPALTCVLQQLVFSLAVTNCILATRTHMRIATCCCPAIW